MYNLNHSLKISIVIIIISILLNPGTSINAQTYEWEIDKHRQTEQKQIQKMDSLMVHLKNNWQLSLGYGRWHFDNSVKLKEISLLEFPQNMGIWNLSLERFFSEKLSAHVNLGILIKKTVPPRPDIFSVLNGANVDVEGGGIFLMPISVGMNYFFSKQRFRPYTGCSVGNVAAKYKFVQASGNLSNGINREEFKFNSNAPFVEFSSGFIYRMGKKAQLGLEGEYIKSKDFNQNIGGYKAYTGFKLSVSYAYLF